MNPLEYLHLQLRLEGKDVIDGDRLRQVEFVPDEEMPLMIITRLADQRVIAYYDERLQPELHRQLRAQVREMVFPEILGLLETLTARDMPVDIGYYQTYVFPADMVNPVHEVQCLSRENPLSQAFGFGHFADSVYAIERYGNLVSACVSTRENDFCAEAWVYTDEHYRHQGFAQQVVRAWAGARIAGGKVPFYSHKVENSASAYLAKRLGLQPVFEEIVFTYVL